MATAAWAAQVKMSGTSTAMTGEATTSLGGSQYQITSASKRIIDPTAAVVVKDGGTPVSSSLYSVDRLFGIVTFSGYSPSGAITVDASYLPTAAVGECTGVTVTVTADLSDVSVLESQAKKKQSTLTDWSGSLERLALPLDDLDSGTGGTQSLDGWMKAGTPRLLDVLFTTGARFRGWFLVESYEVQSSVADVVTVSVKLVGAAQGAGAAFSWGT